MSGRIGVESVEGKGSTFRFTIRLEKSKKVRLVADTETGIDKRPSPKAGEGPPGKRARVTAKNEKKRILLAEDNLINQKLVLKILEKLGYQAEAVLNGEEVLKKLETDSYDLVLMDVQMPVKDGYEATREIRKREPAQPHIPIVALTALAIKGDREKCLDAGMDDYISKPIKPDELHAVITRWLFPE
jgi:CheY-like chemotaxis protein